MSALRGYCVRRSGMGGGVLDFELAAPSFDFEVVEDLADDAAEKAFEVRIVHTLQGADGLLLVALQHEHGFFMRSARLCPLADGGAVERLGQFAVPKFI